MVAAPAAGSRLKHPNPAAYTSAPPVQLEALKPVIGSGRSVPNPVSFESIPVVILYGAPLCTRKNGLMVNFSNSGRLLPSSRRWRISANEDGPHSALRLYGLAGAPSLSSIP